MLIGDAEFVELRLEFSLIDFLEQILEAAVIGFEDRVLGRQIHWPLARDAVIQAGARKVADRIVEVVHPHCDARRRELEDFLVDDGRSEEHKSEPQSLMRISYAV